MKLRETFTDIRESLALKLLHWEPEDHLLYVARQIPGVPTAFDETDRAAFIATFRRTSVNSFYVHAEKTDYIDLDKEGKCTR